MNAAMTDSDYASRTDRSLLLEFRRARYRSAALRGLRRLIDGPWRRSRDESTKPELDGPTLTDAGCRVLVIDAHPPTPSADSGSVRLMALLDVFERAGLRAAFLADDFRDGEQPVRRPCDAQGAPVANVSEAMAWMRRHHESLQLVVLARHAVARCWLPIVRAALPRARVVFDTVDLHHLREQRAAVIARSRPLAMLAQITQRDELALVADCDATWVVSHVEQALLRTHCPDARVDVVSNIVAPEQTTRTFDERTGFVFLGNFRHAPNVDAMDTLLSTLWPLIREQLADARLHVVGSHLDATLRARWSGHAGVQLTGFVEDVHAELQSRRVMLAPLRYGAGVKGKVHAAFACGLPVVASSCAAEGMHLDEGAAACVEDDPQAFARAAVTLYCDRVAWSRVADAGRDCLDRHFSPAAAQAAVFASLASLGIRPLRSGAGGET